MHNNDTQKNTGVFGEFSSMLKTYPILFGTLWVGLFIVLFGMSFMLGIVPKLDTDDEPAVVLSENTTATAQAQEITDSTPRRIIVERLGIDAPIESPERADLSTLDSALLSGAVHYPGSADLEDVGNTFLLGHSTGFRVVQNDAFKVFNGLKDAQEGDLIRVQSDTKEYVYRVTAVSLVNASETDIVLASDTKKLTLATCNVFGKKEERYVVEAEFVGSYELTG